MSNFLITYSSFQNYGFSSAYYSLEDEVINIYDIEKYKDCVVLIPYNYKNIIEPKCFNKQNYQAMPIILPIKKKQIISNFSDITKLLNYLGEDKLQITNSILYQKINYTDYLQNFQKIQEYLKMGDIYEINYCIPFIFRNISLSISKLFIELAQKINAPFTAVMKYQNFYILSFSPERFLKKVSTLLYTEPIKGTAPRGKTPKEDVRNKTELYYNKKERTENAMIVDVCRNDLSRIAQKGTVKVDALYSIKTYNTIHQMVSRISCHVKDNMTFKDIIHASFPMASMTGAPKIRAMQIADELEILPREFYSGTLGVFNNGDFDLSVLIRSIFYDDLKKELKVWAGSAITIYAEPEKEYQECCLKAEKIIQTLKKYLSLQKS